jgi:CRP-like cAMP-binding protein
VPSKPLPKLVRNRILKSLPPAESRRLLRELEILELPRQHPVTEPGQKMRWVYFPESCMISVVSTMKTGACIEVGIIGRRGMAALPVFLGSEDHLMESFVQVPGRAGRVPAEAFQSNAVPGTALYERSLRYASYFLQQVARSAACNSLHRLEQRCARWLMLTADELGRADFSLTHEYLAEMLGVRRASVTDVASEFGERGLVEYSRGRVRIVNPDGLAKAACECYRLVSAEAERMFASAAGRRQSASA